MSVLNNYLTVQETRKYLELNGIDWTEVWIRLQIGMGKIKSQKIFNSRVIPRSELVRIIRERKDGF